MERTSMSRKEFTRGAVLARVKAGEMTLRESAALLNVSYRQATRLYAQYRSGGHAALVHGNVGGGAGQRFGPKLASEHLQSDHALSIPVSTLRDWMLASGQWKRVRKRKVAPRRRQRRPHFGELVQMDGSFHDWYEGRGERAGSKLHDEHGGRCDGRDHVALWGPGNDLGGCRYSAGLDLCARRTACALHGLEERV